eukprot:364647-Chlamydomonas_euryale.AAC.27
MQGTLAVIAGPQRDVDRLVGHDVLHVCDACNYGESVQNALPLFHRKMGSFAHSPGKMVKYHNSPLDHPV